VQFLNEEMSNMILVRKLGAFIYKCNATYMELPAIH